MSRQLSRATEACRSGTYNGKLQLSAADGYSHYEVECSAGTYVRTLIETLGDAYCSSLRRTRIGPFDVADAGRELSPAEVAELVPAVAEALR